MAGRGRSLVTRQDRKTNGGSGANLKTIGLSGKDGGLLARASDVSVTVPAANTARIQECHIAIGHICCELVEFDQRLRRLAA